MSQEVSSSAETKRLRPLATAAGIGSILGSGIIVGLSATITVWQSGLGLTNTQVGIISGALTFAIAIGSLLAGTIAKATGLIRAFNGLNLLYAIGALICVLSNSYGVLLAGVIVTGLASGADLPISLTVVSHDSPNDKVSASLVSSTQIYWQIGIFVSYGCAFIVSAMSGATGARVVFAILAAVALIAWAWRTFSSKFRAFHEEADQRIAKAEADADLSEKVSIKTVFAGANRNKYMGFFFSILIFYVMWNLLANTFGQFQTFTLVQAHASQSFATGAGLVLNLVSLVATVTFASVAGGKYRNPLFLVGITVQFVAMLGLALSSHALWPIVIAIGAYSIGNNLAGEAMYKVWTQEAFPTEVRASVQGFLNGFSRVCCGLFAFITPALVVPSAIRNTMFGFAGIVFISFLAGITMMHLEKKHHVTDL